VASGVIRGNRIARNLEVNFLSRMLTNTEKLSEFPRGTMSLSGSLRNKHQNILYWLKYWKRRFGDERFNNDRALWKEFANSQQIGKENVFSQNT